MPQPRLDISIKKAVLLLAPMVLGLSLAMDVYVPALPNMTRLFHVSAGQMQMTLTLFMLMAGMIQLIAGPLSDHFGRKKVSFVFIALFAIGSALCASASTAIQLIVYRMIQASGSCGMLVVGLAMVRDLFHGNESAKAYSYLNGIIAFSPMFAPFIGSFVDIEFNWQATFLVLLLVALLSFISMQWALPETLAKDKKQKMQLSLFRHYGSIFKHPTFLYYTLLTCAGLSYLYLFCSISPYIIIRLLHIPESHYGFYFCFMGISFFIGSFLSGLIVGHLGIYRTCVLGMILSLIGGLWMAIWYLLEGLSIHNFIWPMLLIGIGGTFGMGTGNGGAMEPFAEHAGAASALGGACRFIFASLIGAIAITSKVSSTLPLALPAIVFSLIGLLLFYIYRSALQIGEKKSEFDLRK